MTRIRRALFGVLADGQPVDCFSLENSGGLRVEVLTYGGIVRSIAVPNADGSATDVVLGFDTVEQYVRDGCYIGPLVGRFANRIAGARFAIDGVEYVLAPNEGPNQLHGGPFGFNRRIWRASVLGESLELTLRSVRGDQGFPGSLTVRATFSLTADNELIIDYRAESDAATHVNLTSHMYFNLAGQANGDVLGHELTLRASHFLPIDASLIPTGELRPVAGTTFDFMRPRRVGGASAHDDPQLGTAGGYDHCFVMDPGAIAGVEPAARLVDRASGRSLEVRTTEPGIQFYMGQGLNGRGKGGCIYRAHSGLALETQHFPDSPNRPEFPSTLLRPGEQFASRTNYRFGGAR